MEQNNKAADLNKKENLQKKQPIKSKMRPPVRHTITSYKRMLKANPLLEYQEAGIDIDELIAQKFKGNSLKSGPLTNDLKSSVTTLNSNQDCNASMSQFRKPDRKPLLRTQSMKLPKKCTIDLGIKKPAIVSGNQPIAGHILNEPKPSTSNIISNGTKPKPKVAFKNLCNAKVENKRPKKRHEVDNIAKVNSFPRGALKTTKSDIGGANPKPPPNPLNTEKKSPLRRSLSSGHLQTKNGYHFDPKQAYTINNEFQSEECLFSAGSSGLKKLSPILKDNNEDNIPFVFKTPSAYDRRSICHFTPCSNRRTTLFLASTPAPTVMQKLQERLSKWLKSRGKPPASFHNLRVFGPNKTKNTTPEKDMDDENKENMEVIKEMSESYDNLSIIEIRNEPNEGRKIKNEIYKNDLSKYAKEAMTELLKLIEEEYPIEQCICWLELIKDKYTKIEDEPEYWECRAAIEQSAGNVHNAVEFYKTAIIQGAEVITVDKSLDQLLKKFSLLNISPSKAEPRAHEKEKERIVTEARNVFKSSIIQFAIRERNIKSPGANRDMFPNRLEILMCELPTRASLIVGGDLNIDYASKELRTTKLSKKDKDDTLSYAAGPSKKLVVTPVRRSTRLSRSAYTNTSGVQLCKSLREIDLLSDEISFEKNKALC